MIHLQTGGQTTGLVVLINANKISLTILRGGKSWNLHVDKKFLLRRKKICRLKANQLRGGEYSRSIIMLIEYLIK